MGFKPESRLRVSSVLSGEMSQGGRKSYSDLFRLSAGVAMDGRGPDVKADTRNFKPTVHTTEAKVPSDHEHAVIPRNVPVKSKR